MVNAKVRTAGEEALAAAFSEAAADPVFLADVDETTKAFRHVDHEAVGEGE